MVLENFVMDEYWENLMSDEFNFEQSHSAEKCKRDDTLGFFTIQTAI